MNSFVKRILVALPTTYILMYYSELAFWAKYNPAEMSFFGLVITYFFYFLITYIFLSVVTMFRVRTVWALFLAGAVYGWLIEGVIVQTMYEYFPLQISWTGLAWHSLISVFIGWYYVTTVILQNNYTDTIRVSLFVGLFYGVWSISWWVEDGFITPLPEFSLYVVVTSLILIGSYYMYNKLQPDPFQPTKIEGYALAGFFIVYFVLITIPVQPAALVVLPPLLGVVYITLRKNKTTEQREDIIAALQGRITPLNFVLLLIIPVTVVLFYACALLLNLLVPTNIFVYMVTALLGIVMFVMSIARIFRRKKVEMDWQ